MRLIVTGGGTGGHVFPALEIAKAARENGHSVIYLGSLRGQEGDACKEANFEFFGYPVSSVGNPFTPKGVRKLIQSFRSISLAKKQIEKWKPDLIFSTGGFSALPVLGAAKSLKTKTVLHEQNTVPGRVHRTAGKFAIKVCSVFEESRGWFGDKTIRTGLPLRVEMLDAAQKKHSTDEKVTLCFGGSQGAQAINEAVLTLSHRLGNSGGRWIQVTGKNLFDTYTKSAEKFNLKSVQIHPFLTATQMASAMSEATLAIARAGSGTCCELALFGIPAIYVPLPSSHADHQFHNAQAIAKIGGATVIRQNALTPSKLEQAWENWQNHPEKKVEASEKLKNWTITNATERVLNILESIAYAS